MENKIQIPDGYKFVREIMPLEITGYIDEGQWIGEVKYVDLRPIYKYGEVWVLRKID